MANKKKPFYSKKTLLLFKLFSVMGVVILLISFIRDFFLGTLFSTTEHFLIAFTFLKISTIILLSIVAFYPYKMGICSIVAFIYAVLILVFEPTNTMGFFMYALGITSLYARGYYNSQRKTKNLITLFTFIALNLTQIHYGLEIFISSMIETVGFAFIYFLSIYFMSAAIKNDYNINSSSRILNLKHYDKLNIRDALWLIQIQNKVKYDAIAINSKVSPGTVKNRLKFIFSVLEVGDKQGFLNEYSTFEICYGEYTSEKIKSMKITETNLIN